MLKNLVAGAAIILATAAFATASVDVRAPGLRVQVGSPEHHAPPPPQVRVIERERVIIKERDNRGYKGKHKGHYKKHRRHKDYSR